MTVIAHCLPTGDSVELDAHLSILRLTSEWSKIAPKGWELDYYSVRAPVSIARETLVELALRKKAGLVVSSAAGVVNVADVVIFQDSDVAVPEASDYVKIAQTLLNAPEDVALVGAPCIQQERTGRRLRVNVWCDNPNEAMQRAQPFECRAIGFGLVAIRASVFSVLDKPWFFFESRPDGRLSGEDVGFCDRIRILGYKVWADPRIEVAHAFRRSFSIRGADLELLAALSGDDP